MIMILMMNNLTQSKKVKMKKVNLQEDYHLEW